jgi:hypothetical protein
LRKETVSSTENYIVVDTTQGATTTEYLKYQNKNKYDFKPMQLVFCWDEKVEKGGSFDVFYKREIGGIYKPEDVTKQIKTDNADCPLDDYQVVGPDGNYSA